MKNKSNKTREREEKLSKKIGEKAPNFSGSKGAEFFRENEEKWIKNEGNK